MGTPDRPVRAEQIVMVDRAGQVTVDPERAVRGEVITTYADGSVDHTLFTASDPSR